MDLHDYIMLRRLPGRKQPAVAFCKAMAENGAKIDAFARREGRLQEMADVLRRRSDPDGE